MASEQKTRINPGLIPYIAALLPDRSRLNLALTSQSNFEDHANILQQNFKNKSHNGLGTVADFEANDGTNALWHAIDYNDISLFSKIVDAVLLNLEDFSWSTLIKRCIFAGSIHCLGYLYSNISGIDGYVHKYWYLLRECALHRRHFHMMLFFEKVYKPVKQSPRIAFERKLSWGIYLEQKLREDGRRADLEWEIFQYRMRDFIRDGIDHRRGRILLRCRSKAEGKIDKHVVLRDPFPCSAPTAPDTVFSLHNVESARAFQWAFNHAAEKMDGVDLQNEVRDSFNAQCGRLHTSAALIETIVKLGCIDVNRAAGVDEFQHESKVKHTRRGPRKSKDLDLMTPLDYAVSHLNIRAVHVLSNLGANINGAKAIMQESQSTERAIGSASEIPGSLWRVFDQKIQNIGRCFWQKGHVDRNYQWRFGQGYNIDEECDKSEMDWVRRTSCQCGSRELFRSMETGWLTQARGFCNRVANMVAVLLEKGAEIRSDLWIQDDNGLHCPSELHPIKRLFDLFRDILRILAKSWYGPRNFVFFSDLEEWLPGLLTAVRLLATRDPSLSAEYTSLRSADFVQLLECIGFQRPAGEFDWTDDRDNIVVLDDTREGKDYCHGLDRFKRDVTWETARQIWYDWGHVDDYGIVKLAKFKEVRSMGYWRKEFANYHLESEHSDADDTEVLYDGGLYSEYRRRVEYRRHAESRMRLLMQV
ncbi:hypothetical protein GGR57DRAFT_304608 [Xylariaceae sp. FL1272]|nr:hypothetical protein GGR57DRAFT_304608 [Xylariaceae sp. FL1272]